MFKYHLKSTDPPMQFNFIKYYRLIELNPRSEKTKLLTEF